MRYNNVYKKEDIVSLVIPVEIKNTDIHTFKYVYCTNKVSISYDLVENGPYKYITINPLNEDCYVIVKFGIYTEFIRVGEPPVLILVNYANLDQNLLEYKQYNYNSEIIAFGTLTYIEDDVYVIPVTKVERSFFVILNNIVTLTLPDRFISMVDYAEGTVELQRGNWQLIAIPEEGKVKDIFIDRLATQEGVPATELIKVASAYPGHINKFLSYIPGFTSETSEHNFDLIVYDNTSREITAFWVECKEWTHRSDNIIFKWKNT